MDSFSRKEYHLHLPQVQIQFQMGHGRRRNYKQSVSEMRQLETFEPVRYVLLRAAMWTADLQGQAVFRLQRAAVMSLAEEAADLAMELNLPLVDQMRE